MPRFARSNASTPASPHEALKALERNLNRERRVFATLIALLIFAALCIAAVAIVSIGFAALREQAVQTRTRSEQTNALLERRFSFLTGAEVITALGGALPPAAQPADKTAPPSCTPTFSGLDTSPELRTACDQIVRLATQVTAHAPILLLSADGSAAYGYDLAPVAHRAADPHLLPAEAARLLTDAIVLRMTARGTDPVTSARNRQAIWFRPAPALGFPPGLVLGAVSALKDGKPSAFAITSVDLDTLGSTPDGLAPALMPTLFDAEGVMLAGPLSPAGAQFIDRSLANWPPGKFLLLARFGWALREEPLVHGFGHYLLALSWRDLAQQIGVPVAVVLLLSAALIAMLVALARYWNRRVLVRTYDAATRALEGELLNHLLVHATPVGLCIVRRGNFEIVAANQIVRNVLGLDEDATRLPNALCAEFEQHSDWPAAARRDDETTVFELPFALERPGDDNLHLAITYAPATMNHEDVMFCAITDMSKHYEVERLLREAKHLSDEAARAKVSFFAAMSHEIRTPLASLVGNIELVARGPLAPEQGARVQAMQISAAELLQIVSDVLDFSKIDVGQMKLAEVPGSIVALLGRIALAHAPIAVRQHLPFYLVMDRAIPATLRFDAVRLAQIVNNLLSNAFKFTRSGKIVLRAAWRDGVLEISVSDSGGGISEELKQHLFQPFTQGDDQRFTQARGTGLGLSICARLAALMRGSIALDSALGVGTRVTVTLPLQPESHATAGDEWTLPDKHPAILCRAPENHEWLANLFDARASTPAFLNLDDPPREDVFDFLLVTGEFGRDDIAPLRRDGLKVVWLRQDGPLVPLEVADGEVEVNLYSLASIRAATLMVAHSGGAAATSAPQPAAETHPQINHFASLNVLIAEDNLLNRGLLRDQLRTLGANVIEAKDGEEALARLDEREVDLLLTDMNMPGMNGDALLQAARAKHPGLPVYAVSSDALPEQIEQGRALGFTDYLTKPVALAELARVLADISAQTRSTQIAAASATTPPRETAAEDDETTADGDLPRFPTLVPPLAGLFIEQADRDIAEFAQIAAQRDDKRLREWAHRVSGGLAVLGPSMLNEACLELRTTLREAGQWTDEVGELATAVVAELEALRSLAAQRDAV